MFNARSGQNLSQESGNGNETSVRPALKIDGENRGRL